MISPEFIDSTMDADSAIDMVRKRWPVLRKPFKYAHRLALYFDHDSATDPIERLLGNGFVVRSVWFYDDHVSICNGWFGHVCKILYTDPNFLNELGDWLSLTGK